MKIISYNDCFIVLKEIKVVALVGQPDNWEVRINFGSEGPLVLWHKDREEALLVFNQLKEEMIHL